MANETTETPVVETPAVEPVSPPSTGEFSNPGADLDDMEADFIAIGLSSEAKPSEEQAEPAKVVEPVGTPVQAVNETPPVVVPPAQQTEQPKPEEKVVDPQQALPVPVVAQPPQQQAPQAPEAGQAGFGLEEVAKAVSENRVKIEEALATQVYKLSDTEVEELNDNPAVVIPKLMSKLHTEVTMNIAAVVAQQLPQAVNGLLEARQRNQVAEDALWAEWPELDRKAHAPLVLQLARQYAQMNPQADQQTRIMNVGQLAVMQLGLLPKAQARLLAKQGGAQPSQVPAQAFVPASRGQVNPPAQQQATNPFEMMARAMELDD